MRPSYSGTVFHLRLLQSTKLKTSPAIINVSQNLLFSSLAQQTGSGYPLRRQEEDGRNIRVSVWWDFENCNLPCSVNVFRVAQCITKGVRSSGIKGPIQITAFGDVMQISRTNQEALSATGVNLTHVPSGGKNSADRSLLVDLMYWVSQHPPPAHIFLISGDRDFSCILHRLRMNNYNVLLASPDNTPSVLCGAATIVWQWSPLVRGENFIGKHFNQPPDGPYGSWYGYYKASLEDPFAVNEQHTNLQPDESFEPGPDSKLRPIPKAVMKYIRHVLNSYPEGIVIAQLRNELTKSNLAIDNDLYGYRKFSRFLSAMPHILRVQAGNDGQLLVRALNNKNTDESISVDHSTNTEESDVGGALKLSEMNSHQEAEKSVLPSNADLKIEHRMTNLQEAQKKDHRNDPYRPLNMQGTIVKAHATTILEVPKKEGKQVESAVLANIQDTGNKDEKVRLQQQPIEVKYDSQVGNNDQLDDIREPRLTAEFGIFRRIWIRLFRWSDANYSGNDVNKVDETRKSKMSCQLIESINPALFSPSSHEALIDGRISKRYDVAGHISRQELGFIAQIVSWFKPQGSPESDNTTENNLEDRVDSYFRKPDIFAKESFWDEMKSFINSSQGLALLSGSKTREHLVQQLQTQGPSVLRPLVERDISLLVDLLISDKKWIEECDSPTSLFKPTQLAGKDLHNNSSSSSNGLSQMFTFDQPIPQFGERKHQNPPHAGVPLTSCHKGSSNKTRSEILVDCRMLVDHIVKEYPEGYCMGSFRKLFLEKHGYTLDLRRIGYEKLVVLLQNFPAVKLENNLIIPVKAQKNCSIQTLGRSSQESKLESSVLLSKEKDGDSWEELGPIDYPSSKKEERKLGCSRNEETEKEVQSFTDYEPLEENDFSDSEDDKANAKSETDSRSNANEEGSSLLHILDSYYNGKDGWSRKGKTVNASNTNESSENIIVSSTLNSLGSKIDSPLAERIRKLRPDKKYSFVLDQCDEGKRNDGVFSSLKKPIQEPC